MGKGLGPKVLKKWLRTYGMGGRSWTEASFADIGIGSSCAAEANLRSDTLMF